MNCNKGRDSLDMVKQWILEHACKYRMEKVIRAVFRRGIDTLLKWKEISEITINPAFMFVTLIECFQEILHNYIQKDNKITWNKNFIILIANLFEDLYIQNRFVSFKIFINIITRLRLMEIMQSMKDEIESTVIVCQLNKYFPHWNKATHEKIQKSYRLANSVSLRKAKKVITVCRRFILGLLINDVRWKNYLKDNFDEDMKGFALVINKELKEVMNILRPELPPSPIEQIFSGAKDDLSNSSDPFVQMLLEHLHSEMDQDDFLNLLASLDPETDSQVNPKSLAGILDGLSDSASIGSDVKLVIDDDDSDAPTEVFDNECVPESDNDVICTKSNLKQHKNPIYENEENDMMSPSEEANKMADFNLDQKRMQNVLKTLENHDDRHDSFDDDDNYDSDDGDDDDNNDEDDNNNDADDDDNNNDEDDNDDDDSYNNEKAGPSFDRNSTDNEISSGSEDESDHCLKSIKSKTRSGVKRQRNQEQSNESESKVATPNLEHQLVVGCGRPCLVNLKEHMVWKMDGIKHEIYS